MKYKWLFCAAVLVLHSCASDSPPAPIDGAPVPAQSQTETSATSSILPPPLPTQTGRDASGQVVPYGTPGMVSTEVPKNMKILKQNYTDSTGKNALFEAVILLADNGIIQEIQVLNPKGDSDRFLKEVTKEVVGKPARDLKIESVDGLE